jgi:hypothetical protein
MKREKTNGPLFLPAIEEMSAHLQVDGTFVSGWQAASSQSFRPITKVGVGFAGLVMMGVSIWAVLPLPSSAGSPSAQPPRRPEVGMREADARIREAFMGHHHLAFMPAALPGVKSKSLLKVGPSAVVQQSRSATLGPAFRREVHMSGAAAPVSAPTDASAATIDANDWRTQPQLPRESWPEAAGKEYRFLRKGDDTFEEYRFSVATGYGIIQDKYVGSRKPGRYKQSRRVSFSVPVDGDARLNVKTLDGTSMKMTAASVDEASMRTIELLRTESSGNPSFAAVELALPLQLKVTKRNQASEDDKYRDIEKQRIVVSNVKEDGHAGLAGIKVGDIIRAVSLPKMAVPSTETGESEDGMVMLDAKEVSVWDASLKDNVQLNGENAKVVLLIERPLNTNEAETLEAQLGELPYTAEKVAKGVKQELQDSAEDLKNDIKERGAKAVIQESVDGISKELQEAANDISKGLDDIQVPSLDDIKKKLTSGDEK